MPVELQGIAKILYAGQTYLLTDGGGVGRVYGKNKIRFLHPADRYGSRDQVLIDRIKTEGKVLPLEPDKEADAKH